MGDFVLTGRICLGTRHVQSLRDHLGLGEAFDVRIECLRLGVSGGPAVSGGGGGVALVFVVGVVWPPPVSPTGVVFITGGAPFVLGGVVVVLGGV
jgi:hypothetical protein